MPRVRYSLLEPYVLGVVGRGRIVCPICHGGSTNERSMLVDTNQHWAKCYRASCGATSGRVRTGTLVDKDFRMPMLDDPANPGVLASMPALYRNRFSTTLGTVHSRVAMPVLDYSSIVQGYMLRSYTGMYPKVIDVLPSTYPRLHFPLRRTADNICAIVEDIPSAEALSTEVNCISLLGTDLTMQKIEYLLGTHDQRYRNLVICLDPDATAKAYRLARQVLSIRVTACALDKDPKDMQDSELRSLGNRILKQVEI